MAELVVIGYDNERMAATVERKVRVLGNSPKIEPDASAVVIRDGDGNFQVRTNYSPITASGTWGIFWDLLFGSFFFVPVLGMSIGRGLDDLMRKVEEVAVNGQFENDVRDIVQPGTSALFLVTSDAHLDEVAERLGEHGGRMVAAPLSDPGLESLRDRLHGEPATGRRLVPRPNIWSVFG